MGGQREKTARNERALRRVVTAEKRWWKQMRKVMKRYDPSQKEMDCDGSQKKELEKVVRVAETWKVGQPMVEGNIWRE
jgi:hypothetical protein